MKDYTRQAIVDFCATAEGWTTVERCLEMAELIITVQPDVVVELGVFGGKSFIPQALALKEVGKGVIYGVDSWKHADTIEGEDDASAKDWWSNNVDLHAIHKLCIEAIWKLGLERFAVLVRSQTQHVHQLFPEIGIVNIDANHSELASVRDIQNYLPRVQKNGWIWVDDADWKTTQKMVGILNEKCCLARDYGHYKLYCNIPPESKFPPNLIPAAVPQQSAA